MSFSAQIRMHNSGKNEHCNEIEPNNNRSHRKARKKFKFHSISISTSINSRRTASIRHCLSFTQSMLEIDFIYKYSNI